MANPTSNFNWQMPTPTDLVTDLPADFEVFGQAVDTSLADLQGGTTGQILAKNSNTNMDFVWITNDVGDITAVTAGTGISGGGTSGAVTITNSMATEIAAKGDLIVGTGSATFDNLTAGNNGETLVADSSTTTGLRWQGDYAAGKNKIINGDLGIWQRGTSLSGAGYLADRFQGVVTTTTITQSQQAFTAGAAPVAGYESSFFYRAVTTSGGTAGSRALVQQPIEDVRTFAGNTVTVSFWAKAASGTPAIGVELAQVFGSGGSSAVTAIGATAKTISTSWARYTVTASVPSISGKTIGTGSSLNLVLWIDAGSDFAARASSIGNQSGTFDIWGVQVEAGSVATAFQTATGTIQGELAACQRYYYRQNAQTAYTHFASGGFASTTTAFKFVVAVPVEMRVVPTSVDFNALAAWDGGATYSLTGVAFEYTNKQQIGFTATSSGMTANRTSLVLSQNNTGAYLGVSAEI